MLRLWRVLLTDIPDFFTYVLIYFKFKWQQAASGYLSSTDQDTRLTKHFPELCVCFDKGNQQLRSERIIFLIIFRANKGVCTLFKMHCAAWSSWLAHIHFCRFLRAEYFHWSAVLAGEQGVNRQREVVGRKELGKAPWFCQMAFDSWLFKSFCGYENKLDFKHFEIKLKLIWVESVELVLIFFFWFICGFVPLSFAISWDLKNKARLVSFNFYSNSFCLHSP